MVCPATTSVVSSAVLTIVIAGVGRIVTSSSFSGSCPAGVLLSSAAVPSSSIEIPPSATADAVLSYVPMGTATPISAISVIVTEPKGGII